MDQTKIESIVNMPAPKSQTEVRRLMGAVNHYKRFIKNLGKIAAPIYSLQKSENKFFWSNECQTAFETLKQKLTTALVLVMPDPDKEFHIRCDASGGALGAEIGQLDENGQFHPMAFASRTLSATEQKYTVSEKEALAIVWSVKYFKTYIYNKTVVISTDHQPLTTYKEIGCPDGRLKKLLLKIIDLDYDLRFKPGRENNMADLLSRLKSAKPEKEQMDDNEIGLFINNLFTTSNQSVSNQHSTKLSNGTCLNGSFNSNATNQVTSDMEAIHSVNTIQIEYNQPNWVVEQKLDSDLNQIINLIKAKQIVFANKSFNSIINQLEISNSDILIKNSNGKRLICVPKHKVLEILNTHHDYQLSGHLGCSKTTQRIKETYY